MKNAKNISEIVVDVTRGNKMIDGMMHTFIEKIKINVTTSNGFNAEMIQQYSYEDGKNSDSVFVCMCEMLGLSKESLYYDFMKQSKHSWNSNCFWFTSETYTRIVD